MKKLLTLVWPHRYWIEGEQCMNLNIWTQSIDPSAKKPVYVYIHGGGFNNGSSIEGAAQEGKNLSAYADIVVVTINHRLKVLGYVQPETKLPPGRRTAGIFPLSASI